MQRTLMPGLICLACVFPQARADDAIPIKTLDEIKSATVFIKVEAGSLKGSGSGFLMKVDGDTGYIVTNDHVISPPKQKPPVTAISLVFWSGTKKEQTVAAQIVATDPSRDLAVLKVSQFKELPQPIDLSQKINLVETMPVYMFGFPFGQALATGKRSPAITVGKGAVSSIRRDERDELAVIQIDGDLNPGNSGGPVVDNQGRLVGVAVAKVNNTRIGMAIPPEELTKMFLGRVGTITIKRKQIVNGTADVQVEAYLIDPMNKMKSVSIYHVHADAIKEKPQVDKDGNWPMLPGSEKVELKIDGQKATGEFKITSDAKISETISFQGAYLNGAGNLCFMQPATFRIDVGKEPVASSPPTPDSRDTPAPRPSLPAGKEPNARATNESLAGPKRQVADATVTDLNLDATNAPRCLCWDADGKAFFFLEAGGTLRRITWPDLKEEQRLDMDSNCGWLCPSAEGLVLTASELQEVWLLDPQNLKVKSRIPVPVETRGISPKERTRIVSSPKLSVAFAVSRDGIAVIDLRAGTIAKERMERGKYWGCSLPVVTPDGNYLFTVGGIEQLQRFKIEGQELKYEGSSQRIATNGQAVEISPNSKYVSLPSGGGNSHDGLKDHPKAPRYSTFVYDVTDLNKPALTIAGGAIRRPWGSTP